MISINNNMGGMRSMDALQQSHRVLQTALERLSTGVRINRAEDDAAGLMVRDRFQAQVNGFEEGIRNIQTAQGMIQVAEQGLNKVTEALQQMRALAVRAADDNLNDEDRGRIQQQVKGLLREINERAANTSYNGHKLLDGSIADSHEERLGQLKTQSQSFLANGGNLISSASTTGSAATTANAISQGSYQVRLVYTGDHGVQPSATSLTELKGTLNSGPNGDAAADLSTLNQIVTDRNGSAHTASFTFSQVGDGSRNFNYTVNIAAGGVYGSAQTFTGTVEFNDDGTLKAVDNHAPDQARNVVLGDGTADGQAWAIDFSGLAENQHATTAAGGVAASATNNGVQGTMTSTMSLSDVNLAAANMVSDSHTTAAFNVVDRTGAEHSVSVTFTKTGEDAATQTYSYQINGLDGGVWNGDNSGNSSGTLVFNAAGSSLLTMNGGSATSFSLRVGDGTSDDQSITVSFAGIVANGAGNTASMTANGTQGSPTTDVQIRDNLFNGTSPDPLTFSVVDRTGQNTSTATMTFSQTGEDSKVWNYTITAPSESGVDGFNGFGSNLQGSVEFDDAGNIIKLDGSDVLSKTITFEDRTAEDQQINLDFTRLNMAAGDDFADSVSDGGTGTTQGEVAAVIYFSDGSGSTDVNPISTLNAVDMEAKTFSAGGVSFTVSQASTLDVGLTSYLKAYTYISATQDDKSLTFQVGPDEGNVTRVGISRMDVDTIFRRNDPEGGTSSYTDVDLSNALKAQDLIGQIDDALNFVGGENLKVGQFQNKFSRTLDLARQQMTSITGALSNLNDADMAKEATNQSKRSILVQSGTAMVAQANSQGQFLLQLLR